MFTTGERWFAVPSPRAAEVVTLPQLTRIPGAPLHMLGLFAHRGEVVPVVNFAALLGWVIRPSGRAILLRALDGTVAVTVENVVGVFALTGTPQPLAATGFESRLSGPADANGQEVSVLDVDGLFEFLSLRPPAQALRSSGG